MNNNKTDGTANLLGANGPSEATKAAQAALDQANSRNAARSQADARFNSGTGYSSLLDQGYKLQGGQLYRPGAKLSTDVAGNTVVE